MAEHLDESLSALADDQLSRDESRFAVRRLCGDDESLARWGRYHTYRAALAGEAVVDLRAGIAQALADDALPSHVAATGDNTVSRWLRPVSGVAVAASVASMVVFFGDNMQLGGDVPAPLAVEVEPDAAVTVPSLSPQALPSDLPRAPSQARLASGSQDQAVTPVDPRLRAYLMRHNEAVRDNGVGPERLRNVPTVAQDVKRAVEETTLAD